MTELLQEVQQVIENVLERANEAKLTLHSPYEAYAVLKNYYDGIKENRHQIKLFLSDFWDDVKEDNIICYPEDLMRINTCAVSCAKAAIKVAAVAQKILDCIKDENAPGAA